MNPDSKCLNELPALLILKNCLSLFNVLTEPISHEIDHLHSTKPFNLTESQYRNQCFLLAILITFKSISYLIWFISSFQHRLQFDNQLYLTGQIETHLKFILDDNVEIEQKIHGAIEYFLNFHQSMQIHTNNQQSCMGYLSYAQSILVDEILAYSKNLDLHTEFKLAIQTYLDYFIQLKKEIGDSWDKLNFTYLEKLANLCELSLILDSNQSNLKKENSVFRQVYD